jgi:diguanylate cyclase (GGDEF)-like protein
MVERRRLKVLLIGGTPQEKGRVVRALDLEQIMIMTAEPARAASRARLVLPDVAVLLHPEAKSLVATIHGIAPVVVVGPEDDTLAEEYLASGVEDYLHEAEVSVTGFLQRSVKRAIARRAARRQLEHVARIDPLTELYNRRGIGELLGRIAQRDVGNTVALLIDLDDFKAINETRGLSGGDEVLRDVADLLRANARPTDIVGRLGGDEFMVILPGADKEAGRIVAERMRRAIEYQGVTASFGLARVDPTASTVDDVVLKTQMLLKNSKSDGKNRVAISSSGLPPVLLANQH